MISQPLQLKCDHKFVFLRQECKNIGFDRSPIYRDSDVFFCEKCLEYRSVDVAERTPRNDGSGFHTKRLK